MQEEILPFSYNKFENDYNLTWTGENFGRFTVNGNDYRFVRTHIEPYVFDITTEMGLAWLLSKRNQEEKD